MNNNIITIVVNDKKIVKLLLALEKYERENLIKVSSVKKILGGVRDIQTLYEQLNYAVNVHLDIVRQLHDLGNFVIRAISLGYEKNNNGQNIEVFKLHDKFSFRVIDSRRAVVSIIKNGD